MGADTFYVYFGVRFSITTADKLALLEQRHDPRLIAARKAQLQTAFGRATGGADHFVLVGCEIGKFGIENRMDFALSEDAVKQIIESTRMKLKKAGVVEEARFHFQVAADY